MQILCKGVWQQSKPILAITKPGKFYLSLKWVLPCKFPHTSYRVGIFNLQNNIEDRQDEHLRKYPYLQLVSSPSSVRQKIHLFIVNWCISETFGMFSWKTAERWLVGYIAMSVIFLLNNFRGSYLFIIENTSLKHIYFREFFFFICENIYIKWENTANFVYGKEPLFSPNVSKNHWACNIAKHCPISMAFINDITAHWIQCIILFSWNRTNINIYLHQKVSGLLFNIDFHTCLLLLMLLCVREGGRGGRMVQMSRHINNSTQSLGCEFEPHVGQLPCADHW